MQAHRAAALGAALGIGVRGLFLSVTTVLALHVLTASASSYDRGPSLALGALCAVAVISQAELLGETIHRARAVQRLADAIDRYN